VEIAADDFVFELIRASRTLGSLLGVARLLGVQPKEIYFWIANIELPTGERRGELETKLRASSLTPAS